jgi:hypothetical protein
MKSICKIIFLVFFIGCYSPKKAERQLNKANENFPSIVAQKTSKWYPCKEVKVVTDSSAYKKWLASLDSIFNKGEDTVHIIDTFEIISQECTKYKNQIAAISSQLSKAKQTIGLIRSRVILAPAVHDTVIKLDSTQIVILTEKISTLEKEKEQHGKKHNFWFKFGISFLIAFLISLIFNILKRKW